MGTNETIRAAVIRLIDLGVNQKTLATKMGLHESWFSRWLNQKRSGYVLPVSALDGFASYLQELNAAIVDAGDSIHEGFEQIARAAAPSVPASGRQPKPRSRTK